MIIRIRMIAGCWIKQIDRLASNIRFIGQIQILYRQRFCSYGLSVDCNAITPTCNSARPWLANTLIPLKSVCLVMRSISCKRWSTSCCRVLIARSELVSFNACTTKCRWPVDYPSPGLMLLQFVCNKEIPSCLLRATWAKLRTLVVMSLAIDKPDSLALLMRNPVDSRARDNSCQARLLMIECSLSKQRWWIAIGEKWHTVAYFTPLMIIIVNLG